MRDALVQAPRLRGGLLRGLCQRGVLSLQVAELLLQLLLPLL